ncbi:hypothetical protein NOCARDAX2BIS_430022 [Nocardioides sp. AX2bis]|nr:hypothetical protein NOCARDAX2BIS_430022 [Nocardioides sp. AX2bis]
MSSARVSPPRTRRMTSRLWVIYGRGSDASRYVRPMQQSKWIYDPSPDNTARTLLGIEGPRPLVCVGINPSTATPGDLDRTVATVERVSVQQGYDGFVMLNVYPQRATDPDDLHATVDSELHEWNMRSIAALANGRDLTVWAAWGTLIRKRKYLAGLLTEIVGLPELRSCTWVSRGARSKAGHPHHPLYVRADAPLEDFDALGYVATL